MSDTSTPKASHFIRDIVVADNASGKYGGRVATRFPPEPNGYLHIGHAKAICVDFGIAREFGGTCNLRFDDTNPTKEDVEYVEAIEEDVRWLGFEWAELRFASDYFEQLYQIAERLIEKGVAYVDSLSDEQIREYRGDYFKKGRESPYRNRSVSENLDLFRRMRKGEFPDGAHVLRAKIDLESQNMNLRDPLLYRIRHVHHHRTGDAWCIYPLYDYAHPLSDAIEKITHSICTLEFESHRPLYDWCIRQAEVFPSQQIEFAKLKLSYTLMSKRRLIQLVENQAVSGWDDPRMPTLAGMRRRGFTPESIRAFAEGVGLAKADSVVDLGLLEYYLREDLNKRCPRLMGVVRPLRLVIEDIPAGETRMLEAPLYPDDPRRGVRQIPFSRELWVERDDFREDPPKDWFRLAPGREVRLRYACLITLKEVVKDASGQVIELRCSHDPASFGNAAPAGRVVRGTLHWVSAETSVSAEVRLYDRLFRVENPGSSEDVSFMQELNPESLEVVSDAKLEPYLATLPVGERVQFERVGYFCKDPDSTDTRSVWNRTVTLKDTWAKLEKKLSTDKSSVPPVKAKAEPKPAEKKADKADKKVSLPLEEIGIEEFSKLDLRVGVVVSAEFVEGADKLLRLAVDIGEAKPRNVFAGIRAYYPNPADLVGKRVTVLSNLRPRTMKFGVSEAMLLVGGGRVATFDDGPKPGDKIS